MSADGEQTGARAHRGKMVFLSRARPSQDWATAREGPLPLLLPPSSPSSPPDLPSLFLFFLSERSSSLSLPLLYCHSSCLTHPSLSLTFPSFFPPPLPPSTSSPSLTFVGLPFFLLFHSPVFPLFFFLLNLFLVFLNNFFGSSLLPLSFFPSQYSSSSFFPSLLIFFLHLRTLFNTSFSCFSFSHLNSFLPVPSLSSLQYCLLLYISLRQWLSRFRSPSTFDYLNINLFSSNCTAYYSFL